MVLIFTFYQTLTLRVTAAHRSMNTFNFTNTVTDELHFTEPNRNYVQILDLGFADLNVILPYTGSVCSWSSVFEIRLLMVQNKQLLKDI